jgi:hypothetical protein
MRASTSGRRRAALIALLAALWPRVAAAHGGVTGTRDLLQDYGVLAFLLAVVLVGAGVVAWVLQTPAEPPDNDAASTAEEPQRAP